MSLSKRPLESNFEGEYEIICPECGSTMIKRRAKRGKFAGQDFFGCSNYPTCKFILNINEISDENIRRRVQEKNLVNNVSTLEDDKSYAQKTNFKSEISYPINLLAREKYLEYQVRFYESMALPRGIFEELNLAQELREEFRQFSQWRLDYPKISPKNILTEYRIILLIALKILTRGHLTTISPFIEKKFIKYYKIQNYNIKNFPLSSYLSVIKQDSNSNIWFDGETESRFYTEILPKYLGQYFRKYVIPQVHLSSLVKIPEQVDKVTQQRVDFLIFFNNKKVVIEIEGADHIGHESRDLNRAEALRNNGYTVFEIGNNEILNGFGDNLNKFIIDFITRIGDKNKELFSNPEKFIISTKISHQIQIAILESLLSGYFDLDNPINILFDCKSLRMSIEDIRYLLKSLADDLNDLINNLRDLYSLNINLQTIKVADFNNKKNQNDIVITYDENLNCNNPKFIIQDISYPNIIAQLSRPCDSLYPTQTTEGILEYFLYYIFGHTSFLEGQYEAISRALIGKDTLVLLPTGAGKSVAFQLTSMILPGVSIVIDPIISLIDDQLDNLERIGIDRTVGISSQITDPNLRTRLIELFGQGEYIFCYIAPERFQTQKFRDTLRSLTISTPVSIIAIDEAHCVSEWGHDFRTAYLNIGRISREYCKFKGNIPPLMALTGTASHAVLKDVQRELQIEDFEAIITPRTFDRQELHYTIYACSSKDKFNNLKGFLLRNLPEKFNISTSSFFFPSGKGTSCGILFCPWVNGEYGVVENCKKLSDHLGISTKYYAGGKPNNWSSIEDWNNYKKITAKAFKNNKFSLMIATKAFGMGIDKPNVRYTIHYGLPNSIESFYQEAGRAGRDHNYAECTIIFSNDDAKRSDFLLNPDLDASELINYMSNNRDKDSDDDITRSLFFHVNSFKGIKQEMIDIQEVINDIGDLQTRRELYIVFQKLDRNAAEKAIHRLLLLGVIADYTIDYAANEFGLKVKGITVEEVIDNYCKYVNGYNKGRVKNERDKIISQPNQAFNDFIESSCEVLINFIYDTIEKGRRRALREMLSLSETAKSGNSDKVTRDRILRYLETTYSEEIENVLNETTSFDHLEKLIDGYVETQTGELIGGIRSPRDAAEIRGQVSRYLESYPDHPGLLILRSISELFSRDFNIDIAVENFKAAIDFSESRYSYSREAIYRTIVWFLTKFYNRDEVICKNIIEELLYKFNDELFASTFINHEDTNDEMIIEPSIFLLNNLSERSLKIFK